MFEQFYYSFPYIILCCIFPTIALSTLQPLDAQSLFEALNIEAVDNKNINLTVDGDGRCVP